MTKQRNQPKTDKQLLFDELVLRGLLPNIKKVYDRYRYDELLTIIDFDNKRKLTPAIQPKPAPVISVVEKLPPIDSKLAAKLQTFARKRKVKPPPKPKPIPKPNIVSGIIRVLRGYVTDIDSSIGMYIYMDEFRNNLGMSRWFIPHEPNTWPRPIIGRTVTRKDLEVYKLDQHPEFDTRVNPVQAPIGHVFTFDTTKLSIEDIVEEYLSSTIESSEPPLIYSISMYNVAKIRQIPGLQHMGVRRANPPRFISHPLVDHQIDNTKNDDCVREYLKFGWDDKKYKGASFWFKPVPKSNDTRIRLDVYLERYWDELYSHKGPWDGHTVTAHMLKLWAVKAEISCYLFDGTMGIIESNIAPLSDRKTLAGIFTCDHFYPIQDTNELHRYHEWASTISKPVAGSLKYDLVKKDRLSVHKKVDETDEEFKQRQLSLELRRIVRSQTKFTWEHAEHKKLSDYDESTLWDVLNSYVKEIQVCDTLDGYGDQLFTWNDTITKPTVLLVDSINFAGLVKYALERNIVLDIDNAMKCVKPINKLDPFRILATRPDITSAKFKPFDQYTILKGWCDMQGIPFTNHITMHRVMTEARHEIEGLDIPNKDQVPITMLQASTLASSYVQQDQKAGRDHSNNVTAIQIVELSKRPYCMASGRQLSLTTNDDKYKFSLDRINNNIGHTLANVRVMSVYDNRVKQRSTLGDYRVRAKYFKDVHSDYNSVTRSAFCGTFENPVKSKALNTTIQFPSYMKNIDLNDDEDIDDDVDNCIDIPGTIGHYRRMVADANKRKSADIVDKKADALMKRLNDYRVDDKKVLSLDQRKINMDTHLHELDRKRCYGTNLYQGTPKYMHDTIGKQDSFLEFDGKVFNFPRFSAYDEIIDSVISFKPTEIPSAGKYYVEFINGKGPSTRDGYVCFTNGWKSAVFVYWIINHRSEKFMITKYCIASKSLKYDHFRGVIDKIHEWVPDMQAKLGVNMIPGELGRVFNKRKYIMTTTSLDEAMYYFLNRGCVKYNTIIPSQSMYDDFKSDETFYTVKIVEKEEIQSNSQPIADMIVEMGAIRTYTMYLGMTWDSEKMCALPHKTIGFKTDAAVVEFTDRGDKQRSIESYKDPLTKIETSGLLVNCTEKWRVVPLNINTCILPNRSFNQIQYDEPEPEPEPDTIPTLKQWLVCELGPSDSWKDKALHRQIVDSKIDMSKSFAIHSDFGGVGKSYLIGLIQQYCNTYNIRTKLTAFTNRVAQNHIDAGGYASTIHSGLCISTLESELYDAKDDYDVLIIDEVSMCPSDILVLISKLKRAIGLRVICVGDWNQRDSIEDHPEATIEERADSTIYRDICDYQMLFLDENLRNDDTIRNVQAKIITCEIPKPHLVVKDFINDHLYHPTMTGIYRGVSADNRTRIQWTKRFNNIWLRDMLPTMEITETLEFEFVDYQAMRHTAENRVTVQCILTHMIPVICTETLGDVNMGVVSVNVTNGREFRIWAWDIQKICLVPTIRGELRYENPIAVGDFVYINRLDFATKFRLNFVSTITTIQGADITEPYIIFGASKLGKRDLNVAIGRATQHTDIFFDMREYDVSEYLAQPKPVNLETPVVQTIEGLGDYMTRTEPDFTGGVSEFAKIYGPESVTDIHANLYDRFIVRDDSQKYRKFYVFDHVEDFNVARSGMDVQCLHEVVSPDIIQRVYFDIDINVPELHETLTILGYNVTLDSIVAYAEFMIDTIKYASMEFANKYTTGNIQFSSDEDIAFHTRVYCSSNENKVSYHVMTPVYCADQRIAKYCFKQIRSHVMFLLSQNSMYPDIPGTLIESIVDANMSRKYSSLRLEGSQKPGQPDRIKWELDSPEGSEFIDSLIGWYPMIGTMLGMPPIYIDSCVDVHDEEQTSMMTDTDTQSKIRSMMLARDPTFDETWSFRDSTLWCLRRKPSHCQNCNRQHDNDNTLYFSNDTSTGHIYQCCIRTKNRIDIGSN